MIVYTVGFVIIYLLPEQNTEKIFKGKRLSEKYQFGRVTERRTLDNVLNSANGELRINGAVSAVQINGCPALDLDSFVSQIIMKCVSFRNFNLRCKVLLT